MIRILLVAAFAAMVLADQPQYLENGNNRVVGGQVANPKAWPWQISLQRLDTGAYSHICGGSLITPSWVMTAAHCVAGSSPLRVVLGTNNIAIIESTQQVRSVRNVIVHQLWDSNNIVNGYDIALIRLSSNVALTPYVVPATLPPAGQILPNNSPCFITGWGYTQTNGVVSNVLMQAFLPVVAYPTCSQTTWWGATVKSSMICAGGLATISGCNGDSGGPLSCQVNGKYVVHGITSFGSSLGCNIAQKPTVFTRVSAYISWIQQNTG